MTDKWLSEKIESRGIEYLSPPPIDLDGARVRETAERLCSQMARGIALPSMTVIDMTPPSLPTCTDIDSAKEVDK
ncbi:hypothetical protein [uncultured Ruegeria sp.]|uniref:hypothetical protein n=1 Tax=uncultured Ruegeria sp. TaxID=259304 RepID=UPI00262D708C|nr:hypothetical protein [uncultured Ruegeria sp.]